MQLVLTGDPDLHYSQVRRTRSLLRRDMEQFLRSLAEEIEAHFLINDLHPAYQALRKMNSKPSSPVSSYRGAILKLKSGKVAGICSILTKLLKAGSEAMAWGLHVLAAIWWSSKVLARILLRHIRDQLLWHQRLDLSGFTPGKSTMDRILQVTLEYRLEFGCRLLVTYIDLKKAVDMVHQESLWEILRLRGIPTRTNSKSVYCSGVRQSCVLAPTIFNTCVDWILFRATVQSHCGTPGNIKVTDLDFADDIVSESLKSLVVVLGAFSNEAKPLDLEVSWTKIQDFGDLLGEPIHSVCTCGKDIVTENFTHLGSVIHNSGLSDQEVSRLIGLAAGVMNS
ncbi:uncharacterized protein [Penaeus vannamei]|uniref:uncharacterized protein n=1 Tax=Penaeus vannamei TaxID=6689 RepID=UPI00387F5AB2